IQVTFINALSTEAGVIENYPDRPRRPIAPQGREVFTASDARFYGTLDAEGRSFEVRVVNPDIGRPSVWILNQTTVTRVFDESLSEGQRIWSYAFIVERLADTADYKVFEITVQLVK